MSGHNMIVLVCPDKYTLFFIQKLSEYVNIPVTAHL